VGVQDTAYGKASVTACFLVLCPRTQPVSIAQKVVSDQLATRNFARATLSFDVYENDTGKKLLKFSLAGGPNVFSSLSFERSMSHGCGCKLTK
jgi:hypothetical protein